MAVKSGDRIVDVIEIEDGALWPLPEGHRLVEDRAMIASPGMTLGDEELLADPAVVPPEPVPRNLAAELDAMKAVLIEEDPTRAGKIEDKLPQDSKGG